MRVSERRAMSKKTGHLELMVREVEPLALRRLRHPLDARSEVVAVVRACSPVHNRQAMPMVKQGKVWHGPPYRSCSAPRGECHRN